MSRGVNRALLLGNVGDDPEVRATSGGKRVAKLSLATNQSWTDASGAKKEATQWHSVQCWGKLADVVEQYVRKGDRLYIEGRIEYNKVEGDDGKARYYTNIVASELVMLGGKDRQQDSADDLPPMAKASAKAAAKEPGEDLPF